MNSEQDTFDRLRRIPHEEMRRIISELYKTVPGDDFARVMPARLAALERHGWTELEYTNTLKQEQNRRLAQQHAQLFAAGQ